MERKKTEEEGKEERSSQKEKTTGPGEDEKGERRMGNGRPGCIVWKGENGKEKYEQWKQTKVFIKGEERGRGQRGEEKKKGNK